jgi:hypothetical protein
VTRSVHPTFSCERLAYRSFSGSCEASRRVRRQAPPHALAEGHRRILVQRRYDSLPQNSALSGKNESSNTSEAMARPLPSQGNFPFDNGLGWAPVFDGERLQHVKASCSGRVHSR